jgi:hypothetical protein
MQLKNHIITILILFIYSLSVSASENWQKIDNNLYIDVNSIEKQDGGYTTGYFKQTNTNEIKKRKQVAYTKIWAGAYCDIEMLSSIKKLEYPIYWYYDKNNKLIAEDNIHKYWKKHYPDGHLGIMHAEDDDFSELYYNTLCNF